jgi:hypothetical protein
MFDFGLLFGDFGAAECVSWVVRGHVMEATAIQSAARACFQGSIYHIICIGFAKSEHIYLQTQL